MQFVLGAINDPFSNCLYHFPVVTAEDYATEIKEEFLACNTEKQLVQGQGHLRLVNKKFCVRWTQY